MEVTSPITKSLQDEHVVAIDPPLKPDLPGVWRRRINAFTGRAISDKALTAEQNMRSGLQRLQGLSMTAGIIEGMMVSVDNDSMKASPGNAWLRVAPGLGLARSGEDVSIGAARQLSLAMLPLVVPESSASAIRGTPPEPSPVTPVSAVPVRLRRPISEKLREGEPMATRLMPELPRTLSLPLGEVVDKPAAADLPRIAILVAQPISATIMGRAGDNCPPDPRDDPYADLQRIDGVRLLLYSWPSERVARSSGPDYAMPPSGPTLRNQLAYRIFDVERSFQGDEMHPWEAWGLPLALIGFDADWKLDFIDRASVVRQGGAPLPRTTMVPQSGNPQLWQARIEQLVEHLTALPDLEDVTLRQSLSRIPPAAVLPASCYDGLARRQHFFPGGFGVTAVPIPQSNLDLAIKEAASLVPFNLSAPDRVELLIPVPDPMYDPGLLETALVDGGFATAIVEMEKDRGIWLARREQIRRRYDRLMESVSGVAISWPTADTPLSEISPPPAFEPPFNATRTRRFSAGTTPSAHSVTTDATLTVAKDDLLWFWVRVHNSSGLSGLTLRFAPKAEEGILQVLGPGVFWGDATGMAITTITTTGLAERRVGDLPAMGGWVRLEAPANRAWLPTGRTIADIAISAVEFVQKGGDIEYGPFGKTDAKGNETVWIADEAPGSAVFRVGEFSMTPSEWPWTDIASRAAPDIVGYGTERVGNSRKVLALDLFRTEWTQPFLAADIRQLEERGIDSYLGEIEARLKATNDAIDLGFVRARSDIYRVRQFMLGGDAASRLVTSPSLADLALRDEGARATSEGIGKFIEAVKTRKPLGVTFATKTPPPPPPPTGSPPPPPPPQAEFGTRNIGFLGAVMANNVSDRPFAAMARASTFEMATLSVAAQPKVSEFASASFATREPQVASRAMTMVQPTMPVLNFAAASSFSTPLLVSQLSLSPSRYIPKDIVAQRPLPGLIERTISVAERLTPAPAVQALEYAIASKAAVLQTLKSLIGTGKDRPKGIAMGDLGVPGFAIKTKTPAPPPPTLELLFKDQAKASEADRDYVDLDVLIDKPRTEEGVPVKPSDKHESDYFTAAVNAIDNAIAMMRLVEGRVSLFEQLAESARELRTATLANANAAAAELRSVDVEIAEARHDIGIAQALLAEETARVDLLNARRSATLANHVPLIAYRRVRECDHRRLAPTQELLSGLAEQPVAACRRDHPDTPDEIKRYAGLLTDAPVKWFPTVAAEVARIDKIDAAMAALEHSRQLAIAAQSFSTQNAVMHFAGAPKFLAGAMQAMHAQQQNLAVRRFAATQINIAAISRLSLAQAQTELREISTLGDIASGKHRHPRLAGLAAGEISGIAEIASCLHAEFAEVAPIIRLGWAEILSEFDRPADLRHLSGLPRWQEAPRETRRSLQGLVDWLYSRIDPDNEKAVDYINDLVRVTLLLASHAPVKRLISARLIAEAPARVGSRLTLAVDTSLVRKGMVALIRDNQNRLISRATIDDLGDGRASARIVANFAQVTTLVPTMRIELAADHRQMR